MSLAATDPKAFLREHYNVSRETLERLDAYVALLLTWNARINLIGRTTEADIWRRHVIDSAQLLPLLPENTRVLTDLGSGAGLPGVVLSLCGVPEVHLVESNNKKAAFLREAARLSAGKVVVHEARIEKLTPWQGDVLTARALASLQDLFALAENFIATHSVFICPKGANVVEELKEATIYWDMDSSSAPSVTETQGTILSLRNIRRCV